MLDYLGDDAVTPTPRCRRKASRTLDGFLFDAKQGYCQQFSGAMALLLRMAGIPARVVTGFSTGATDTKTGEYIVRDFDAHSWVEAYYPGWGWLTFDPTPAASPARSQPADAASIPRLEHRRGADAVRRRPALRARRRRPASPPSRAPWWRIPLFVVGALAARSACSSLAVRRWRRGAPPALSELERALRAHPPRAGARARPCTRSSCASPGTPAAAGYVRALRESRYRDAPSAPDPRAAPRPAVRARTRRRDLLGRLRAWWALPPR